MDQKWVELYQEAKSAAGHAYAPYSGFRVGAAVLCRDGSVFTGVNVENASYGATICAERSAVSAAVTANHRDLEAIAICSPDGVASPCGICRQVIFEFGDRIKVITGSDASDLTVREIREWLPDGFRLCMKS